ncbi:uncharacterized protein LOC116303754 [Actinia tenebrosa]|uniref:Uncharacterized protein LOC116303754 n=1 Tax=Actinia tenebrosa TaxID=6105 RepID=A0A6P8IQ53_ACTTE|nr:uncharacterized protein LOC116303754 [Actinia tenebrosa]XP_031569207.1 uncharacterized protein LOC116303754 [Actinia tenebrosa]XP_031569208.1 uncharacterized protein LOC116303754 [Actinia tenebrosa]XP_031569209.1 uncharacterized protein LOC116303754 [Actinia tenebrosa]
MAMVKVLAVFFFLIESCAIQQTSAAQNTDCPTEQLKVTALLLPPYVIHVNATTHQGIAYDFIKKGLERCFDHCQVGSVSWTFVNNTKDLVEIVTNKSTDIAFPITSYVEYELEKSEDWFSENHSDFVFEEMMESPGLSHVIHTENFNHKARMHIVSNLLEIWPIVVFCLLLAGTSGIFVWALEYRINRSQFPKNFFTGSYEGFWWAFVTMTTVGYGDKTPKSVCGRLFGVLWILIGLVIIAVFTAGATNSLNAGITYYESGIKGKHIGVLKYSEAGNVGVKNGAEISEYDNFKSMHKHLDEDKLDGLLIDRYEAAFLLDKWHRKDLRVLDTIDKEISYKMVRLYDRNTALGNNSCFQGRILRHTRLTQNLVNLYIKPIRAFNIAQHSVGIFSSTAPSTMITAAVFSGTFACLIILGSIYQLIYRRCGLSRRKTYNAEDEMINMHSLMLKELGESVKTLIEDLDKLRNKLHKLDAKELCEKKMNGHAANITIYSRSHENE